MSKKVAPPQYQTLVRDMGFDPDTVPVAEFKTEFEPWDLDKQYPPTVGELLAHLSTPQEDTDADAEREEEADEAWGGGRPVPGGPEDGEPVGTEQEADVDQDAGGTPPVSA
jgi:hypothetical protein